MVFRPHDRSFEAYHRSHHHMVDAMVHRCLCITFSNVLDWWSLATPIHKTSLRSCAARPSYNVPSWATFLTMTRLTAHCCSCLHSTSLAQYFRAGAWHSRIPGVSWKVSYPFQL
ncbi:hypothetical protein BAUCODRAFT_198852 [Baudoinia panamericana UAMH 10762]|uniref:Uncharacterized protein n=1 Tax=Baudoinia panamericana (strain UAMH 10762) TaxID=717646 RepID=M2NQ52_BAUPA|nr:uncharacterized protein BAUCODRAFT_198852 [Baudoinia panamericana UAMH 10762]EMD01151.1 hypothetical protein BAUCODRAFT_198852 [Baudoinia panamericana UAMH 10762]